jgi:hypothetical protein
MLDSSRDATPVVVFGFVEFEIVQTMSRMVLPIRCNPGAPIWLTTMDDDPDDVSVVKRSAIESPEFWREICIFQTGIGVPIYK